MEKLGLEPRIIECKSTVIPISPNPLVAHTGIEPVFYPWKGYVLTDRRMGQIVGICSSHILGFPHTLERYSGFEPDPSLWKRDKPPTILIAQFEVEFLCVVRSCLVNFSSPSLPIPFSREQHFWASARNRTPFSWVQIKYITIYVSEANKLESVLVSVLQVSPCCFTIS